MPIRAAVPADIPQIMALAAQSETAAHWSTREYEALFALDAPRRIAFIAEQRPQAITGFVIARCGPDEWEIENLVVDPEVRRQGIAQSLVEAILGEARSCGIAAVLLEVRESNTAARALYGKLGFKEEGGRSRYYSQPEEDAVLFRVLTADC